MSIREERRQMNLAGFARWFLEQPLGKIRPPKDAVYHYKMRGGVASSVVLYRDAPFQVEIISVVPDDEHSSFPEHRHPNVDSIEVHLSGDLGFTIRGAGVASLADLSRIDDDGASALCGSWKRVRPTDVHGAVPGSGGAFLSFQKWLNGTSPTSIALDWEGVPHLAVKQA